MACSCPGNQIQCAALNDYVGIVVFTDNGSGSIICIKVEGSVSPEGGRTSFFYINRVLIIRIVDGICPCQVYCGIAIDVQLPHRGIIEINS